MTLLPEQSYQTKLPGLHRVQQLFDDTQLPDRASAVRTALFDESIRSRIKPRMKIALLVGSRGITGLDEIVAATGETLREMGAEPFVVPAMGSHGGADATGQREVLASYGVTETRVGMRIESCMEVELLGATSPHGVPVYADRTALKADMIVPIARVKPHTDFHGPIESGICKMLTIGMGKHVGCATLHRYGFENFPWLIPKAGAFVLSHAPIGFALAIVENAYDKTYLIEAVPSERIMEREPELLLCARERMPRILLAQIDVLIVEYIGKDVSGAGMDPNIVGRTTRGRIPSFAGPQIGRILVEGITEASHGNACGIGLADFMLKRCLDSVDWRATSINAVSSGNPEAARLPVVVEDEREGILACMQTAACCDENNLRIVKIRDTLSLAEISISPALLPEASAHPCMRIIT